MAGIVDHLDDAVVEPEIADMIADDDIDLFGKDDAEGMIANAVIAITVTSARRRFAGNLDRIGAVDAIDPRGTGIKTHQAEHAEAAAKVHDDVAWPDGLCHGLLKQPIPDRVGDIPEMLLQSSAQWLEAPFRATMQRHLVAGDPKHGVIDGTISVFTNYDGVWNNLLDLVGHHAKLATSAKFDKFRLKVE